MCANELETECESELDFSLASEFHAGENSFVVSLLTFQNNGPEVLQHVPVKKKRHAYTLKKKYQTILQIEEFIAMYVLPELTHQFYSEGMGLH